MEDAIRLKELQIELNSKSGLGSLPLVRWAGSPSHIETMGQANLCATFDEALHRAKTLLQEG